MNKSVLIICLIFHSFRYFYNSANGKHSEALRRGLIKLKESEGEGSCSNDSDGKNPAKGERGNIPAHIDRNGDWKLRKYIFTIDGVQYMFQDYASQLFCHLRQHVFQIDHRKYFASLTENSLEHWENPNKSGSKMLITADGNFMLKSLLFKLNEHNFLKNLLHHYATYLSAHPNSFIVRFVGLYTIETVNSDDKIWFMTMPNILAPALATNMSIDYRFDLKGCSFGRKVKMEEWKKDMPTFRDWEFNGHRNLEAIFPNGIILEEIPYKIISEILAADIKFLGEGISVLDYSLFVSIHFNEENEEKEAANIIEQGIGPLTRMRNGGIPAHCIGCKLPANKEVINGNDVQQRKRSISILFGIIDIIFQWNPYFHQKLVNRCHVKRECHESEQPLIHPKSYAARFKCFINRDVFHIEDVNKMRQYEMKHCIEFNNIDWSKNLPNLAAMNEHSNALGQKTTGWN